MPDANGQSEARLPSQRLVGRITNNRWRHRIFSDIDAKAVEFEDVDFSYSLITRGYFHKAKFRKCRFVGTRFSECNFRQASFTQCDFSYGVFDQTLIKFDQVEYSLPTFPNVRKDLLQLLRANAVSI